MKVSYVWTSFGIVFCLACSDSLGPPLNGRWADSGIELIAAGGERELRLPCVRPVQLSRRVGFDGAGRIQFSGKVRELWYSFDFTFAGELNGDTLAATVTRFVPGQAPWSSAYRMTPDGLSGLERQVCLA
jgi:hypothetical protein